MCLGRRPASLLILTLFAACGGNHPPLATIERVPGSTEHEIKRLDPATRTIEPLDSTKVIRPLGPRASSPREIRPGGGSLGPGREILPLEGDAVPVDETTWRGSNYEGDLVLEFLIGGILRYAAPSGTWTNGTWAQAGNVITFEMNSHYADYTGRIRGSGMSGTAHDRNGRTWNWEATRQ